MTMPLQVEAYDRMAVAADSMQQPTAVSAARFGAGEIRTGGVRWLSRGRSRIECTNDMGISRISTVLVDH